MDVEKIKKDIPNLLYKILKNTNRLTVEEINEICSKLGKSLMGYLKRNK